MSDLYSRSKDEDGFLYIQYTDHDAFGSLIGGRVIE